MAEEKKDDGGSQSMSLEEAHKHLEAILPIIAKMQEMIAGGGAKTGEATDDDAEENTGEDEDKGGEEKPAEEKKSEGMDAAEIARQVESRMVEKTKLYEQLSTHIGAFDHADMSVESMAKYGCKKLGLEVPKEGRLGFLRGYLAAKPAPSANAAMDSAAPRTGNFVHRHLNKE